MGRPAKLSIELPYNAQFQTTYTINDTKQEIDYVSYSFKNYSVYNPVRKENYLTIFVRNHKLIGVTIKDEASGEGGTLNCEIKADPLSRTN